MDKKSTRETRGIPAEILKLFGSCRSILTRFADRLNGSLRDYDIRLPEQGIWCWNIVCLIAGRRFCFQVGTTLQLAETGHFAIMLLAHDQEIFGPAASAAYRELGDGEYAWITSHEYLEEVLELAEWHARQVAANLPWRPAPSVSA